MIRFLTAPTALHGCEARINAGTFDREPVLRYAAGQEAVMTAFLSDRKLNISLQYFTPTSHRRSAI